MLAAFLFIIMGLVVIIQARSLHKKEASKLFTPQQIERKKRILKRGGYFLVVGGLVLLAMRLTWK